MTEGHRRLREMEERRRPFRAGGTRAPGIPVVAVGGSSWWLLGMLGGWVAGSYLLHGCPRGGVGVSLGLGGRQRRVQEGGEVWIWDMEALGLGFWHLRLPPTPRPPPPPAPARPPSAWGGVVYPEFSRGRGQSRGGLTRGGGGGVVLGTGVARRPNSVGLEQRGWMLRSQFVGGWGVGAV